MDNGSRKPGVRMPETGGPLAHLNEDTLETLTRYGERSAEEWRRADYYRYRVAL